MAIKTLSSDSKSALVSALERSGGEVSSQARQVSSRSPAEAVDSRASSTEVGVGMAQEYLPSGRTL